MQLTIQIPICFISLSVFFLSSCNDGIALKNKSEWAALDTVKISERVHNAVINYNDSGYLKARLYAPLIEGHKNATRPFIELPKGLKADFYNNDKEIESSLSAGYGINYQDSKIIEVQKQVVVINSKGEKLITEQLFWDQIKKEIYTDKTVVITTPTEELHGTGLRAAQDFSSWKILKVSGKIMPK